MTALGIEMTTNDPTTTWADNLSREADPPIPEVVNARQAADEAWKRQNAAADALENFTGDPCGAEHDRLVEEVQAITKEAIRAEYRYQIVYHEHYNVIPLDMEAAAMVIQIRERKV